MPRTYTAASCGLAGQVTAPPTSVNRDRAGNTTIEEYTFTMATPEVIAPPNQAPAGAPENGDGIVLDVVRHPSMFRTQLLGPAEGSPTLLGRMPIA